MSIKIVRHTTAIKPEPKKLEQQISIDDLRLDALTLDDGDGTLGSLQESLDRCFALLEPHLDNDQLLKNASRIASIVKRSPFSLLDNGLVDRFSAELSQAKSPLKSIVLISVAQIAIICGRFSEPHLIRIFPSILNCAALPDKQVSNCASIAARTLLAKFDSEVATLIYPSLLAACDGSAKSGKRVLALSSIQALCKLSVKIMRRCLAEIIPVVASCMTDFNPDVCKQATATMNAICGTINNKDLTQVLPKLVEATADYTKVPECIKALHATTFVRELDTPALAMIVPILSRALNDRSTAVVYRQSTVIVSNFCKLIPNPEDANSFLPQLVPGLQRVIDIGADPELREIALEALSTVNALIQQGQSVKASTGMSNFFRLSLAVREAFAGVPDVVVSFVAELIKQMCINHDFDLEDWKSLQEFLEKTPSTVDVNWDSLRMQCFNMFKGDKESLEAQNHEILCSVKFSLGYGGMILLKDANLELRRGARYGIVGKNGCGKSTLMKAIANGQVDGFPSSDILKTVYVSHSFQGADFQGTVKEFVAKSFDGSLTESEIEAILLEFGFDETLRTQQVMNLSGGWKMKLELAMAALKKADVLLLDEPTNHLDAKNCMWLEKYLNTTTTFTVLLVSHDPNFLDSVCSHIIHYNEKQLKTYKMDFSKFNEIVPEAKTYMEYQVPDFAYNFPNPGNLDSVKSANRTILRLRDVCFTYPNTDRQILFDVNVRVSLSSRIAIIGPNGAGKSTMIKVLTGEIYPTTGKVQRHGSLRIAYVAQHAFHHLEQHQEKSPNSYIRWRYESGIDKEMLAKETRTLSQTELAQKSEMNIECICGRQKLKRSYRYEIKLVGHGFDETLWVPRERLEELGFKAMIEAYDDYEASRGGNYERDTSVKSVEQHLQEFGIDPEIGTHGNIKGLSGGQKVKIVLAAAMWLRPHILIMDEPTNYLDQQSLLALGNAIKNFKGGIVIISHNSNFVDSCCSEVWEMNGGRLNRRVQGSEDLLGQTVEEDDESHLVDAAELAKQNAPSSTNDNNENELKQEENGAVDAKQAKPKKPVREPGKKKETRRDRLRKEKIKLDKLKKYGPKPDGTEYSSDEEQEVHINVGSIN